MANARSQQDTPRSSSRSSSSSRTSSRTAAAARDEVLGMLRDDHKRVKKAFRDFEKLDPQDEEACQALVQQVCAELEIHAELEEELFYPAARAALSEEALLDEAEVEHMTFKVLIEQLKGMEPADDKFVATFTVLGEYVKHHVKEEESEIFKDLGRARIDWRALCDEMQQAKRDMMMERGLLTDDAEASSEEGKGESANGTARTH
ncbi:hemerythrin domain-containing protein [Aquabacterium fontiphilum]|jgi:hemerythrin-like domain-containing protein|uniref:hemerythrin domain-containing protein n=1 Tax=Aquabacterium fontiphilum TaxID=450365 RepID=UPI001376CCCA|nr:hemerythrin domain-containing protein [Aquabacterium fontiphilum]NBD22147.1 hemerythrin domain-containing protein [Aquabacterium fontiphilum]